MDRDPMEKALSTDVVMDIILSHLKASDLLSCRLASKFWNKAASSVLRRRSTLIRDISEEKDLKKLQECMETSLDFPFAGLKFSKPWKFKTGRVMKFSKKYGERFTRLCLDHCWAENLHDLAPFIGYLPRLSILEIEQSLVSPSSRIRWSSSAGRHECDKILKLPALRTIALSWHCRNVNENVLREVLAAASPSLRIECLDAQPGILRVLKGAGRLRALSVIRFTQDYRNQQFALEMDQLLSTEPPSLTKLNFSSGGCVGLDGLKKLLSSSQNTLQELNLDGMYACEHWDEFPVLRKLTKLSVRLGSELWSFLYQCSHGQRFPALKEVHLDGCSEIVPSVFSDGLFVVPSVTKIRLSGYVNEFGMKQLAQSFPNVTEMGLSYSYYSRVHRPLVNTYEIWNVGEFKCLEKLSIWNYIPTQPSKDYINTDSFLTGIPVEMCETLRKQKQLDLMNSPDAEALRCNPNILKLENLKELVVMPVGGWKQLCKDTPFISMVSVKYALEMMPNLRTKFVYRNPSRLSVSEERDLAALEDAFKDVQPYVKLEPFFC